MAQYPGRLESANTKEFGIVSAVEIAGHRTVKTTDDLYTISDAILSESKNNTNNDAIGQEWFVISENEYYRLINWENRKSSTGWAAQPRPDSLNTKLGEEIVRAKAVEDKIEASVGLNADGSHKKTTGNYTGQANTITEEISALDTEAKKINDSLTSHKSDKANPHGVTKVQIGLGSVDNTADMDKPVSKAQTAADKKVADDAAKNLKAHTDKVDNPHNVTKEQIGLSNVTNDAQVKRTEMGVAGGVATLDESGLVPSSQLPSFVDDVLEFDNLTSFPGKGESGKIYVDTTTNLTYRWAGSTYIEISKSLALGETSSTAYPGDKGVETANKLKEHTASNENPHNVTKVQIGLGSVDNTSDINKPISKATQTALDGKVDKVPGSGLILDTLKTEISEHLKSKANPHNVTKEQVGLGSVDNTADVDKPVSKATQTALEGKVDKVPGSGLISDAEKEKLNNIPDLTPITEHLKSKANPHEVTKEQVGLGKVENTADLEKPISTATLEALKGKVDKVSGSGLILDTLKTEISEHLKSKANPHGVTKEQVGLGNVDNTADVNKPISKATQTALDGKVDKVPGSGLIPDALKTEITGHAGNKNNPHSVTKAQIGLENVDNTSDANKPISNLTKAALDGKVNNTVTVNGHALSGNITVTKGDIGLGSVENLAPTDYPVSKATQTALDGKVDKVKGSVLITEIDLTNLKAHTTNKENPHGVTKEQVGLGNVDNTSDANKPISTATQGELDKIKRVTAEGMMALCDKIRDNDEIMAEILNLINSRLVYLESKVK